MPKTRRFSDRIPANIRHGPVGVVLVSKGDPVFVPEARKQSGVGKVITVVVGNRHGDALPLIVGAGKRAWRLSQL